MENKKQKKELENDTKVDVENVDYDKMQKMFDCAKDLKNDFANVPVYFAKAFSTDAGKKVLAWLCNMTLGRYLPPSAKETELWYLEGQRYIVHFIINMINNGK